MDEKDILEQEFDLDDIINEFKDQPDTEEETSEEPEVVAEPEEEEQPQPVSGDTVKFTPVSTDTVRLDEIPQNQAIVHNAVHIDDEDEMNLPPQEEKAEPYSQEWEPEYEQPISEYIPAPPITFKPKSRLREIKKALVNGPEKQYYKLSEVGVGKLQLALFLSVLVVLASAVTTALYAFEILPSTRLRFMVFGQFLAMLVSALLGSFQMIEGGADLLKGRFSLNTLLIFSFILCTVDGVFGLKDQRIPCCAAFSLQVTMSLWSTYQERTVKLGQLDTMRKATILDGVYAVENYAEERKGILRDQGEVEHYMDNYQDTAPQQKIISVYAMIVLGVSLATGALAGVLHGLTAGIQVAAVTLLAATPASIFLICSRPMAVLEKRLHAVGTVLCGWKGVLALGGKAVFPITHQDLFPQGRVKMNGVKFFGDRLPDQIISYAAALMKLSGGTLEPLFTNLLDSRNGIHYDVENFNRYEGGIGGEVNNESVLAGTLDFLKTMGVEVPEGLRVNQAVCVSVDGELCGLFAITYEKDRNAAAGLATLCGYRKLRPMLISDDFMLTKAFIHKQFGVNADRILIPDQEMRQAMEQVKKEENAEAAALVTKEGLASFAYAVTGARSLKTSVKLGVVIHMIGGILGIVMMILLALLGETRLLTPINLFLYELIWLIPGLLVTEWTRNI